MAFLPEDQTQQQQQGQQQGQIPTVPQIPTLQGTSGGSAGSGAGVTNTASPGSAPSSPWQNITSYLNANAGQAGNVAGTIAGNLQNQYNAANQAIGQQSQNYSQQIQAGSNPYNADVANQAASNPANFVQNPNNVSAFNKMFTGQYKGPANFSGTSDYTNLENQVQKAQQNASLVNQGTPGLQTLLQNFSNAQGRSPTAGDTTLDTLLLQEDPNNFQTLHNAAAPFSNLTNSLSSTQQALDAAAQQAAKQSVQTQQTIQNQFVGPGGVLPNWQQGLNTNQQNANKSLQAYNQQVGSLFNQGQLADNALRAFTSQTGAKLDDPFAAILGLTPITTPPTLENTASAKDFADQQALSQLTGQNVNVLNSQLANQAGTFRVPTAPLPNLGDAAMAAAHAAAQASRDQKLDPQALNLWNLFSALHSYNPNIEAEGDPKSGYWATGTN